jgi:hypothetical protein
MLPNPPGISIQFFYDDDVPAAVETLLTVLLPPSRPPEPVGAPAPVPSEAIATDTAGDEAA